MTVFYNKLDNGHVMTLWCGGIFPWKETCAGAYLLYCHQFSFYYQLLRLLWSFGSQGRGQRSRPLLPSIGYFLPFSEASKASNYSDSSPVRQLSPPRMLPLPLQAGLRAVQVPKSTIECGCPWTRETWRRARKGPSPACSLYFSSFFLGDSRDLVSKIPFSRLNVKSAAPDWWSDLTNRFKETKWRVACKQNKSWLGRVGSTNIKQNQTTFQQNIFIPS